MARPRKEDARDVPASALAAGLRLLEQQGSTDFTMADLAAACGCKAPALYNHFQNKAEVLRVLHGEGFRRLYEDYMLPAGQQQGGALERLRAAGLNYVRFAQDYPALYRLMFAPQSEWATDCAPGGPPPPYNSFGLLIEAVRACQLEGHGKRLDSLQLSFTLWSALHGAIELARQSQGPQQLMLGGAETIVANLIHLIRKDHSS